MVVVEDAEDFKEEDEAGVDDNNRTLGNSLTLTLKIRTIRFRIKFRTIHFSNNNKIPTITYVGLGHTTNTVGHMGHTDILQTFAEFQLRDTAGKKHLTTK